MILPEDEKLKQYTQMFAERTWIVRALLREVAQ